MNGRTNNNSNSGTSGAQTTGTTAPAARTIDPAASGKEVNVEELKRLLKSLPEGAEIITKPVSLAGEKRTFSRTASQNSEPKAAGGMFFREPKRIKVTEKVDEDARMAVQEDAEAIKAKEALKAEFDKWEEKFTPRIAEDTEGTIRFINQKYPRFAPGWKWMNNDNIAEHERLDIWKAEKVDGKAFLLAQIYGMTTPGETHVELVVAALERHEATKRVEGMKASHYEVKSVAKNKGGGVSATLVILCENQEAAKRLLLAPAFTYEDDDNIAAIWVQDPYSTGEWVILDMTNAPLEKNDFLKGCYGLFKDQIAWSKAEKNKGKHVPVDFRVAKVTRAIARPAVTQGKGKTAADKKAAALEKAVQQDPTTEIWRVAFKLSQNAAKKWIIPKNGGPNGAKGEVRIEIPPFCDTCISWSHQRRHCQWWDEQSVVEKVARPWDHLPMAWENIKSFAEAKKAWESIAKETDKEESNTQRS